jgi:hypothetical protein
MGLEVRAADPAALYGFGGAGHDAAWCPQVSGFFTVFRQPPAASRVADVKRPKSKRFPDYRPTPGGRCWCQEILHSPSVMPLPVERCVCKSLLYRQFPVDGMIIAESLRGWVKPSVIGRVTNQSRGSRQ